MEENGVGPGREGALLFTCTLGAGNLCGGLLFCAFAGFLSHLFGELIPVSHADCFLLL